MKTIRWLVFAALTGFSFLTSQAQVLVINARITGTSGIYEGMFAMNDPLVLTLDFTGNHDLLNGLQPEAEYRPITELSVAGRPFPIFSESPTTATFINQPSEHGLSIYQSSGNFDTAAGGYVLTFSMLSAHDIGVTRNIFPAGISYSAFGSNAPGAVINRFRDEANNPQVRGTFDWQLIDYVGSVTLPELPPPPPMTPVPEPSTYGLFGALILVGVAAHRKLKRQRIVSGKLAIVCPEPA